MLDAIDAAVAGIVESDSDSAIRQTPHVERLMRIMRPRPRSSRDLMDGLVLKSRVGFGERIISPQPRVMDVGIKLYRQSISWNPWHGCRRVSEGCRNCYMFEGDSRRGLDGSEVRRSKTQFELPLKRDRNGRYACRDCFFMTSLTSDFFIEDADCWRDEAWDVIRKRRDVPFIILTKRPERIRECLPDDWNTGYPNVRLSVSVENQRTWDQRVPILQSIPSLKRDVFIAPMIGRVDAEGLLSEGGIDCIYLGGEYGPGSRPCEYDWVSSVRDSCVRHGVTFYWRNAGDVLVKDGFAMEFDSLREQSEYAERSGMDFIVDPVVRMTQTTLF